MFTNDLGLRSQLDLAVHLCSNQASDVYDGLRLRRFVKGVKKMGASATSIY
ncbi:MAG: hypothetical protein V7K90_12985 [Nostoc sp.]|uniref:hypothetical protein n=1 Tax=Nostoc sp. TaxID=1180 RepID=UPI002FF51E8B